MKIICFRLKTEFSNASSTLEGFCFLEKPSNYGLGKEEGN